MPGPPATNRSTRRASPRSTQWERFPWSLGVSVLVFVLACVAAYRYALPAVASTVAMRLPASIVRTLSDTTLRSLDAQALSPSTLSPERRREIDARFAQLAPATAGVRYRLVYRNGGVLGANALALPSGDIVITDALVMLAETNDEIMGVLAHEIAHVEARHGLRLVVQGSALTVMVGLVVGDVTSLLAIAPTVLLQSKYSRDFERDADTRAVELLRARGIPPSRLADILERIEAWDDAGRPAIGPGRDAEAPAPVERPAVGVMDYVSTHPATPERLDYLRSH